MYDSIWCILDDSGCEQFGWHVAIEDFAVQSPVTCFDEAAEVVRTVAGAFACGGMYQLGVFSPQSPITWYKAVELIEGIKEMNAEQGRSFDESGLHFEILEPGDYDSGSAEVTLYSNEEILSPEDLLQMTVGALMDMQ